jgi:hypothetical protein
MEIFAMLGVHDHIAIVASPGPVGRELPEAV